MYIDQTGLAQRFGTEIDEIIGADPSATPPVDGDTERLARACEDATTLIDGYLAARYTLPLTATPPIVVAWAADIARFKLWDERAPEEVRKRYDDAIAQLRDLAAGRIALPPDAQGTAPSAGFNAGSYSAERLFTSETLAGF